jgi:uridine kinase
MNVGAISGFGPVGSVSIKEGDLLHRRDWLAEYLPSKLPRAGTSTEFASILSSMNCVPLRIRIGGYPACGKSTLSRQIVDRLDGAIHIESESWILPLAERKIKDLSGAHPESYDIAKAVLDLGALLNGAPIHLPSYSHELGRHDGGLTVRMPRAGHLILDGTPFTVHEFDSICAFCLFLVPAHFEDWIAAAIERDVESRFFTRAEATRHNMRKARDLDLVWSRSPQAVAVKCYISSEEFHYEVTP